MQAYAGQERLDLFSVIVVGQLNDPDLRKRGIDK